MCVCVAIFYLICAAFGGWSLLSPDTSSTNEEEEKKTHFYWQLFIFFFSLLGPFFMRHCTRAFIFTMRTMYVRLFLFFFLSISSCLHIRRPMNPNLEPIIIEIFIQKSKCTFFPLQMHRFWVCIVWQRADECVIDFSSLCRLSTSFWLFSIVIHRLQ